jgi:hypothetical protein
MKSIYAITEKRKECQEKPQHVLFGINESDLRSATMFTEARQKVNWNRETWGLLCTDKTYKWLLDRLIFSGFDPFEIPEATEIYLKEMKRKKICFYKEVVMI